MGIQHMPCTGCSGPTARDHRQRLGFRERSPRTDATLPTSHAATTFPLGDRQGLPFVLHLWENAPALEATQGQLDGFFSQLPYKCHQNRVASVGD